MSCVRALGGRKYGAAYERGQLVPLVLWKRSEPAPERCEFIFWALEGKAIW
jgi:hypothetical protein